MPDRTTQSRSGERVLQHAADSKASLAPRLNPLEPVNEIGHYAGHGVPAIYSFVKYVLMRANGAVSAMLVALILLLFYAQSVERWFIGQFSARNCLSRSLHEIGQAYASSFLEVVEAYPPVLTVAANGSIELTDGSSNATIKDYHDLEPTYSEVLAVHSFALSYGHPFVGKYAPPQVAFNRVTWNLTVVSAGRQFDRLGSVYLGDVEVFRTSTAEPTTNGIRWTYLKDMTNFLSLFQHEQILIFDLGNLINDVYTASFNITLTASYFTAEDSVTPADLILPVSARNGAQGMPSVFTVPPDIASNALLFPRNVKKAIFTVAATGQSEEEFWWSNVLQSDVSTFPEEGALYGYSPFREVQLLIDGKLAGVAWPFPVIFTGGVVPGLWRPVVGIDAFDLKEDEIDITPWLPLLCDGQKHNFTIRVAGLLDDGTGHATLSTTTGSYWLITGKVFIWLDEEGHHTTGTTPRMDFPSPTFDVSSTILKTANGTNDTLLYDVTAKRSLSVASRVFTSRGPEVAVWRQSLTFSNSGNFSSRGNVEINSQNTHGFDLSSSGYIKQYNYPLYAYTIYGSNGDNITIHGNVDRGKDVKLLGQSAFPTGLEPFSVVHATQARYPTFQGCWLSTSQSGDATYLSNQTEQTSYSYGCTKQELSFRGIGAEFSADAHGFPPINLYEELFSRYLSAANNTILRDEETLEATRSAHARHQGDRRSEELTPRAIRRRDPLLALQWAA